MLPLLRTNPHLVHRLATALLIAALAACTRDPPPDLDLILVSLDTVRADVFDAVAAADPELGPLLKASVRFKAAASPVPLTLPAHASLLSGLDPNHHGVRTNGDMLDHSVPLLAERLRERGYRTSAVVSAFPLDRQFGLARGFDRYDQPSTGAPSNSGSSILERRGDLSVDIALDVLKDKMQPQFLWVHLFDAHAPYAAPGAPAGLGMHDAYRAEVAFVANQLTRLVRALDERGRPYVLVVVGDHGEGLGDHNELDHGLLLYDSTLLVPMFWYAPDLYPASTPDQTARLIDVAPTLAAIAGVDAASGFDGIDLHPLLVGKNLDIPPAYAETHYPEIAYRKSPLRSLRDGHWKVIATRDESELFELATDPAESRDRSATDAALAAAMQLDVWQRPEPKAATTPVAKDVARQLQGLGYVTASDPEHPADGHPRSVIASHRRLVELQTMVGVAPAQDVIASARDLARDEPANAFAHEVLGSLLLQNGVIGDAVVALDQSSRLNPANSETRYKLAEALMHAGRHIEALRHWQILEIETPQRAGVWSNEAASLATLGNWEEAWRAAQQGLSLGAKDANALDNAATIAERLQRWGDAAQLQQQLALLADPPFREFGRLALNQLRTGSNDAAQRSLAEAANRGIHDPLLALAQILLTQRQGQPAQAGAQAKALKSQHVRLWQSATREFPELGALPD